MGYTLFSFFVVLAAAGMGDYRGTLDPVIRKLILDHPAFL
jgi:hypothetical protein